MKLKRKFFGRILASLMLLASSLPCAFNGQAQITYRGFVEGGLGATIVEKASSSESSGPNGTYGFRGSNYGGGVGFSYMLATTHGIQLKNNFIGIGLGITPSYCAVGSYSYYRDYWEETIESVSNSRLSKVSIPAYFNWRYDFFSSNSSLKPYVGVKIGVFIPITEFEVAYQTTNSYSSTYEKLDCSTGSLLYAAIDLGLRKRISESSGISFGLSIQNSNDAKVYWDSYAYLEDGIGISVLAKVAFDF